MKISWWDRNVKIRYKCLMVIDEFLTVLWYQPNEFISWNHWPLQQWICQPVTLVNHLLELSARLRHHFSSRRNTLQRLQHFVKILLLVNQNNIERKPMRQKMHSKWYKYLTTDYVWRGAALWPSKYFSVWTTVSFIYHNINCSVFYVLRYGDGAGNTVEENSSVFSLIRMC